MNKITLKNIGAIIAGFITVAALSVITDQVLEHVGFFPSAEQGLFDTNLLIIALAYRCLYTILGGYVTAKLSATNPMRQVKILCVLGFIGGGLGVIAGWDLSQHWYPIAICLTAIPLTYLGGKLGK